MLLVFFFPFDKTSRRDFVFLDNLFCFVSLMAVFFDDLLLELAFEFIHSGKEMRG